MSVRRERVAVVVDDHRRWPRRLAVVLLLVILVLLAGGGWYFSSQIRSDALAVEESEPTFDIEVVGVTAATLTFALPPDPPDDLVSGEVLGVLWDGGYGRVSAIVSRTDTEIARSFTSITGTSPRVGDLVALDGFAYPEDPAEAGLDLASVEYRSDFGDFEAWFAPGEGATWAIFVHGRGATPREGLRVLPALLERQIPTMLIEYRNDPGAPSTDDHLARFGATEWADLEGAVAYALERGADDVVLIGYSMGGAISMSFLDRSDLAPRVRAVVLDAPALKLGAMVDARAAETELPLLPFTVPMPITATAKMLTAFRFDIDWDEIDYLDTAGEIAVPVLVLHGTEDETVPVELSRRLAVTRPDLVTLEEFDGAGHVRSWNVDPERYLELVGTFLDAALASP